MAGESNFMIFSYNGCLLFLEREREKKKREIPFWGKNEDYIIWQAKLDRGKDFEAALQRLRGAKSDISEEAMDIRVNSHLKKNTLAAVLDFDFDEISSFDDLSVVP